MSLHALAGHMASKGRGSDSMLVHMTPEEVQSLQVLALKGGGTLTINPDTGLPEANFLKKMLPMIAGFALGPAGFGLMSAGMAGAAVGGITALSTGSLSRGLMAGLGAYGGASLGAGLAGSGAGAAQEAAMAGLTQEQIAQRALEQGVTQQGVLNQAAANATDAFNASGIGSKLSQGATAAFNDPKAFIQGMGGTAKAIGATAAAVSPMMAADTVQTTTPRQDTGYIRQKKFNPYTQQYIDLEPVKASEWGSRNFSDYADGGIVALANGGFTDAQVASYIQNNNLSGQALKDAGDVFGLNADQLGRAQALLTNKDPSIQAASQAYAAQVANRPDLVEQNLGFYNPATQTGSGWEDVATNRYIQDQPGANYAQIAAAKQGAGVTNEDLARSFDRYGYSDALYNVTTSPDWQNELGMTGFAGLSSNINAYVNKANQVDMTPAEKRARAYADMTNSGMNMKDVVRATGKTIDELFPDLKKPVVPPAIIGIPTPEGTTLPGGVSGGGNTAVNPDGTITTAPNIPGRPPGGFTGIGQLRDVYTQGGGSLGQSNLFVPKTLDDLYARYGNTGGSEQAYDYLMGKGAVDIKKPVTKSGELMLPYSQAVLGQEIAAASGPATQKYLFDPKTRRYILNPAYTTAQENAKKETPKVTEDSTVGGANGGVMGMALGGLGALAGGGSTSQYNLGGYSDGGRLLRGPGDGVSDSIPATIGDKQPARLADGEFVVPARIVSELGNGSTEAGARKLYAMMDRVQKARGKTTGKNRVAANTRSDKYLPA